MTSLKNIITLIEDFAPLAMQEPWDNSGLQLGDTQSQVWSAVVTLDPTLEAVEKAIQTQSQLIISHHPLLMQGVKSITPNTTLGKIILTAAAHNIAIYSSHTAMDSAPNGINQWIAEKLQLEHIENLTLSGLGRTGVLPQTLTVAQFAATLKDIFGLTVIRTNANAESLISRVAICGGSGGSLIAQAQSSHVDAYICGDLKYHNFQEALPLMIFDIGHFESENQFISIISSIISKKLPTFALHNINSNFTSLI